VTVVITKKIMMVLAIVIVGTLFGGTLALLATDSQEAAKDLEKEKATAVSNASFYELAYAKVTVEQKEELDKIVADTRIGLPGEWRWPVLIVIGDLPKDTPRLSAEQAAKLFDSKEISDLESEFNKIAGAPDFVGGSGIERSIYFLNDGRSEAIILMLNDVFHIVYNDDGTQTRLPVGTQILPSASRTTY
jgi:hypothetical protein